MHRVLFIENNDSFSWNVIDALPCPRQSIRVVRAIDAREALAESDAVVVGPGPTDPIRAGLVEVVQEALRRHIPLLGVCLGHQALGLAFGATLKRSAPAHGKQATVRFGSSRLFQGIEGPVQVMRYHSLSLTDVKVPLRVVASHEDGTVMAIEHESLPMAGLQFHPDSFGTPRGQEILKAFFSSTQILAPAPELRTSSLLGRDNFALLGPGYAPHGGWTLFEDLHPHDHHTPALWFLSAETRAPRATRLVGRMTQVTPTFDVPMGPLNVELEETGFIEGVRKVRESIAAGDVYQVNLTARANLESSSGASLLSTLCHSRVPRFAAWVKADGVGELVSASPELLFELRNRWIHVEPMKGTAAAGQRDWLEASEKDRAELAMITDLLRDDLQRLCSPASVRVTNARRLLELPYAVQAVSDVEGELQGEKTLEDILSVLHPGGSVTGAPRAAALESIAQLEATPRGAYCGTLGLELGETARFALLIRTAERVGPTWRYGVGAGITWDSDPQTELEEVRLKLGALKS